MLAWCDLEMTGLDPTKDLIVEIATLITDDDLNLIAEGPDLVLGAPQDLLDGMIPVVKEMHANSGLTAAIGASTLTIADAQQQTMEFLREHIGEPKTVPLCGNSIGTDRRFLAMQMPEVEEWLHYRSIDVSTIKELARRWFPEAANASPNKKGGHRALDDIRESLDELRYYRDAVFRRPVA